VTALAAADVVRPTNLLEARDAMLDAGRDRTLLIRGGATKLDWGAPARRTDLVVDTTGMSALLAHDPADATAKVQAGMRLADLQDQLATTGQWLAIDPPHADATVGGVFAANATGPRRLRYGGMRDLVIGTTMVTADGAVARSGGNVIKNVAGYDLAKLLCGSLGTLGLVAELIVRLHPLPAASTTVTAAITPELATQVTLALLASPLVVSAIDWSLGTLAIRIEGREAGVDEQTGAVTELLTRHGASPVAVTGADETAIWEHMAQGHAGVEGETVAVAATLPSAFADVAASFAQACQTAGVDGDLSSHLGHGLHTARLAEADAAAHAAVVRGWRQRVAQLGGHVTVRRRSDDLNDPALIWGGEPPAIALMRAVKQQFDPQARCAPGRFVGGI
jgi:glycolate oxidase FAD binding subunit